MQHQVNAQDHLALTPDNVVRWGINNRSLVAGLCRRLLLPGSKITGLSNFRQLVQLAKDGHACLLCLKHRSNLDVPTFDALLSDHGQGELFDSMIWVAGRTLEEDTGVTRMLVQCFNRLIVTPYRWFQRDRTEAQLHQARQINIAAERALSQLRHEGWVCALFPSGTRIRPDDESTKQAIAQTDSYLRLFDYLLLGNIDGCTLPVSRDRDFTHETPQLDRTPPLITSNGPRLANVSDRTNRARRIE
ncbi:1-acyl-sn-glycerol-3-phosphate acyltransferase [Rhodopirellula sp. JC639]|uniref:1-acyl-sn-glycerol-3-phosphate acyltransferase n=1 Tax=Stieleria mannarensis TaxID=2755585 RepID=UPI001603F134|nr:1-acyl-sn-glycerol-3-phosphate acyltransferase [Rhodopirellula sp. JC639]